jgi:hypothetical protein
MRRAVDGSAAMNRQEISAAFGRIKTLHVVAAAPGFYVVTPRRDKAGVICASRLPVIAWVLDALHTTWPVTTRETLTDDKGDPPAILCPDGYVHDFASTWASLDNWLHDQKAKRAIPAGKVSI